MSPAHESIQTLNRTHQEIEQMSLKSTIHRSILAGVSLIAALLLMGLGAGTAKADFGIVDWDGTTLDSNGDPFTQAGGHPDTVSTIFHINTRPSDNEPIFGVSDGQPKDIQVELPPGVAGDPTATPAKCTAAQLSSPDVNNACPPESQVGEITLINAAFGFPLTTKLFNMAPQPGRAAQFGFNFLFILQLEASLRADDYGLNINAENTPQTAPLGGIGVEFWGVPADHGSGDQRHALLRQPTSCTGPMETTLAINQWEDYDNWQTASFLSHDLADNPIGNTGCENVPFHPTVNSQPTSSKADSPTGLEVDISLPTDGIKNPDGVSQADLKDVTMHFPEGMSVNPSAADGLGACSEDQIALGQEQTASCPDDSKIGTVEMTTPVLEETLEGSVYQAEQDDNPFGSTLALYINAVNEERGIDIKLAGEIATDENTGQLTATFEDNPQLPLENMNLRFKGGARAPLATPPTCGTYEIVTELSPWSAADPDNPTADEIVTQTSSFTIDKGPDGGACLAGDPNEPGDPADLADRPFEPTMNAGVTNPVGGAFTPFVFQLKRPDGHQEILATSVSPPEGVTAKLADVPLCEESDVNAGSCGPESEVGMTIDAGGAGPFPAYNEGEGKVYMAGPYDPDGAGPEPEAPLSMLIREHVMAGPFDLGEVLIRAAVYVDPTTARLSVVSDELPQILEGIPLRIRDIRVKIDREGFTVAPTDCSEQQVEATAYGSHGAEAELSKRFQVADCASLPFGPEFDFQANNSDATDRSDHPALDTTVEFNQPDGAYASANGVRPSANIAKAQVTLPSSIILDQDSLETICTRQDYADGNCPANTQYGTAVAHSPLLDEPLEGPVYLRASDNPLPDLVADLDGIIDIDLAGEISQTGGNNSRLRTTFDGVPDQAVSSFNLKLNGGANGLLVNSQNVCASKDRRTVDVKAFGQNGLSSFQSPRISIRECTRKAERKADRLERRAAKLEKKAKRAKRKGNKRKARKLQRKANKKLRKARKTRRAAR